MKLSQIKKEARSNLAGKWGKGALITLCYFLIMWGINIVANYIPLVGSIATFVINVPISYGIIVSFIKLKRNEEVSYVGFLQDGFAVFGKTWAVTGNILLKMIVPLVLFIISIVLLIISMVILAFSLSMSSATIGAGLPSSSPGLIIELLSAISTILLVISYIWLIVKGFFYILANFILYDNPDMPAKEIVQKSENLMRGNRGKYVLLSLSFIGWIILTVFSLGIGFFWLMPYMMIAEVIFYEKLSEKSDIIVDKEENVDPIQEQ